METYHTLKNIMGTRRKQRDIPWHREVNRLVRNGKDIKEVARIYQESQDRIINSVKKYKQFFFLEYTKGMRPVEFGYKDSPYHMSENEMMRDFQYKYEDLSTAEKKIWDKLN
jgi:hypothetical protein